ncbi:MAG: hypothetical protein IJW48_01885 [Clostridia bacterium]|nr:hypothetical protein [Clostridia bacterium]
MSSLAITVIEGEVRISDLTLSRGDMVFCPAGASEMVFIPKGEAELISAGVPEGE